MTTHLWHALAVAAGGATGALIRYLINLGFQRSGLGGLPAATLTVNVVGCLLAGLILVWLETRLDAALWRNLLVVGVLGALTTFSALGLELWQLVRADRYLLAAIIAIAHVGLGVVAVGAGWKLGRVVF